MKIPIQKTKTPLRKTSFPKQKEKLPNAQISIVIIDIFFEIITLPFRIPKYIRHLVKPKKTQKTQAKTKPLSSIPRSFLRETHPIKTRFDQSLDIHQVKKTRALEFRPITQDILFTSHKKSKKRSLLNEFLRSIHYFENKKRWTYGIIGIVILIAFGGGYSIISHISNSLRIVSANTTSAVDSLKEAENAIRLQDFETAREEFFSAQNAFEIAESELYRNATLGNIPGFGARFDAAKAILETGKTISESGIRLINSIEPVTEILEGGTSSMVTETTSIAEYSAIVMNTLSDARPQILTSLNEIKTSGNSLKLININVLDSKTATELQDTISKIDKLENILKDTYDLADVLPELLGANGTRNYFLMFQNTAERRATGGFLGSYGIITFENGELTRVFTDNIYNPDGQVEIQGFTEDAPVELQMYLGVSRWSLRDANWSPDFPTSAHKVVDFYTKISNTKIDGVISITPEVLQRLIELTGPVYLEQWDTTLTADNVLDILQYKVTVEQKDSANPKLFLSNLANVLLNRIMKMTPKEWVSITTIFSEGIENKTIMFAPFYDKAALLSREKNWDGHLKNYDYDYLMINNSNINASKTSKYIDEQYYLETTILENGQVQNTLQITYNHLGTWDWPSGEIRNFQRIYVPLGSELIESTTTDTGGIKNGITTVNEELNRTVFGDIINLKPGDTITLRYTYILPFNISPDVNMKYSIIIQKQPGLSSIPFKRRIVFDKYHLDPFTISNGPTDVYHFTEDHILEGTLLIDADHKFEMVFKEHDVLNK